MWSKEIIWRIIRIIGALILFLFAIDLMSQSFQNLGISTAESILFTVSNPFIGLFVGLLITAVIQSSSTSTIMVVAMVASNALTIPEAIPIIMGANVGTTLTSTIVSLGFITERTAFRKALSAAVVHDFFNILTVIILFPLELYFGILSSTAIRITDIIIPSGAILTSDFNFYLSISPSEWLLKTFGNSFIFLLVSFIILFLSLKYLGKFLSNLIIDKSKDKLKKYIFKNPLKSFSWGTLLTAVIQSSTITTSLVVPLVATGRVKLKNAVPFIMGANIGTTITAFIAALLKSNAALSIAIAHLLFNLIGVLLFLPMPFLRKFLISLSASFGKIVLNYRLAGLLYILLLFFITPFTLIFFNRESNIDVIELTYEKIDFEKDETTYSTILNKNIDNKRYNQWIIFNHGAGYERESPSEIYNITKTKNILFINDRFYFLNKEGFCWEGEGTTGDYKMCVEKIFQDFELNPQHKFDSVFLYTKAILNKKSGDSLIIQEYIDVNDRLLLIKRKFNKKGELIYQEKLLETKEL